MSRGSPARRKRRSYSGVESSLLVGRREGERRARPALLAEDERHLPRWAEALGGIRTKGRARFVKVQRAQQIAPEEALLARHLLTLRHPSNTLRLVDRRGWKQTSGTPGSPDFANREYFVNALQMSIFFGKGPASCARFARW